MERREAKPGHSLYILQKGRLGRTGRLFFTVAVSGRHGFWSGQKFPPEQKGKVLCPTHLYINRHVRLNRIDVVFKGLRRRMFIENARRLRGIHRYKPQFFAFKFFAT